MTQGLIKTTIVGCGSLGSAIAIGLRGAPAQDIALSLFDRNPQKIENLIKTGHEGKIDIPKTLADAVRKADVVIVAVKPKDFAEVIPKIADVMGPSALLVSCAAGLKIDAIAALSSKQFAVARVMPNTAVSVHQGTTAFSLGPACNETRDELRLLRIFGFLGYVKRVMHEEAMHALTALSGSGPAFYLLALEAMIEAGVRGGLSWSDAHFFARGGLMAAAALSTHTALSPADLKAQICSPAGTTIEGLSALEEAGTRAAYMKAVQKTIDRSRSFESVLK